MACAICGKLNVAADPCEHQAEPAPRERMVPYWQLHDTMREIVNEAKHGTTADVIRLVLTEGDRALRRFRESGPSGSVGTTAEGAEAA
jgi:predicted amidophosphoribosyltransferase